MRSFPIPDEDQEVAAYPIAVVKGSGNAVLAQAFIDYVLSADGQALLTARGFRGRP
jgi:ABC-type Fe3+ transport system substrate-binding protein